MTQLHEQSILNLPRPDLAQPSMTGQDQVLEGMLSERYPNCDRRLLSDALAKMTELFHALPGNFTLELTGQFIDDPIKLLAQRSRDSTVGENGELIVRLNPVDKMAFLTLYEKMNDYLRKMYKPIFDMPREDFLRDFKRNGIVQASRAEAFDRLVCPVDPLAWVPSQSPAIVGRQQFGVTTPYSFQYSIAIPGIDGLPVNALTILVAETAEKQPVEVISETVSFPEAQDDVDWDLVFHAAELGLKNDTYPYACLIIPSEELSTIILAANRNHKIGESLEGHAEHRGMHEVHYLSTNYMGFGIINPEYRSKMLSIAQLCPGCSQMAREKGIAAIDYALEQPSQWSGQSYLEDDRLTGDCGPPIPSIQATKYTPRALKIFERANSYYFPGKFAETLKANQDIEPES